jgi:hypothetical protein
VAASIARTAITSVPIHKNLKLEYKKPYIRR